jgi:signal transduction histidine kinase
MFRFQAARNMLPGRTEEAIQTLDDAIVGSEQAMTESEDAIRDLRSQTAEQMDLVQLLTATSQELTASRDASIKSPIFNVTVEGERRALSPILQDELYRITREVLRNTFRHAGANRIEAEIRYDSHEFRLRIRDDGKGMDAKILTEGGPTGHWGLRGIRERAQRIGGQIDLWSEDGAGTEVQLTVPAAVAYGTPVDSSGFWVFRKARKNEHGS